MAGGQERVLRQADPQRPGDEEDHQGDGAHRRVPDRPRPAADRGQPPLPRGHGPRSSWPRRRATRPPRASCSARPSRPSGWRSSRSSVTAGCRGRTTPRCSGPASGWRPSCAARAAPRSRMYTVGKKAPSYFRFRGIPVARSFHGLPGQAVVRGRAGDRGDGRRRRSSPASSTSCCWCRRGTCRPARRSCARSSCCRCPTRPPTAAADGRATTTPSTPLDGYTEFEPDAARLLAELAPRAVESEIFTALLEAAASFFTAQQRAMAAATDNADELIRTLQPHHEPRPAGLDHDRDHGDRRRRRGAPSTEGSLTLMTTTAPETADDRGHRPRERPGRGDRRPRRRRGVPAARPARDQLRGRDGPRARGPHRHRDRRGRPADRRGPRALRLHAADRRPGPWRGGPQHRPRHQRAGRRRDARARVQRARPAARHRRHRAGRRPLGDPPRRRRRSTSSSRAPTMFETGIKVIDLLEPYVQGGKIGLFGGAGVGKTVLIQEMINRVADPPRRCVGVRRRRRAHPRGHRPAAGDAASPASSRRPRSSTARWTSRRASGCAWRWPR